METTLLEKGQGTAKFSVVMTAEDVEKTIRDGKPSQEAVERLIRIACRQALTGMALKAVEQFEIDCGPFTEAGMTATVTVPFRQAQTVIGYKGVEIRRAAREQMLEAALEAALEQSGVSAPQELVDNELTMLIIGLNHDLQYEAMATGSSTIFLQKEIEDQMDELQEQAVKEVKTKLLLEGIIQAEKLTATREELEAEANRIAQEQRISMEMVEDFLGSDLRMIEGDLLLRKAQEFILDHAVIVDN